MLDHIAGHCDEYGTIAIAAMHDVTLAARSAGQVICLCRGRILADGPPETVLKPALLAQLYGVEAEIAHGASGSVSIVPLCPLD